MSYAYQSGRDLGIENHIVVLPCGRRRDSWSKRRLAPAVHFTMPGGRRFDRMFRSFLFMCVAVENKSMHPLLHPFGELADKTDWQKWLDQLFTPRKNLDALCDLVDGPVDVWISLPYPRRDQSSFGDIFGKNLDFIHDEDRFDAVTWWMNSFIQRWQQSVHLHDKLMFRGFVWLREVILDEDAQLVTRINHEIHERNLLTLWLPNYGSYQFWEWRQLGFDAAALNSNYASRGPYGREWLEWTGMAARTYNVGIQIPCEHGIFHGDTDLLDYFNLGLPEYYSYMINSLVVYRFTNDSVRKMYRKDFENYLRLYTFIRGIYQKTVYPGMDY